MKTLFTIFSLLFMVVLSKAQDIKIEPGSLGLNANEERTKFDLKVTNNTDRIQKVYWKLIKSPSFPAEWKTIVADNNIEYIPNFDMIAVSKPNEFRENEIGQWSVTVLNKCVSGESKLYLELYSDPLFTQLITTTDTNAVYNVDCSVNAQDIASEDITIIYPNPTAQSFSIKSDANVGKVVVKDITGKTIITEDYLEGKSYDSSILPTGTYNVTLLDKQGAILKVLKLSKQRSY